MEHTFNVQNAIDFGISEAIVINNLYFWIIKNEANHKHFYDGRFWTYNSTSAFSELFPYLSTSQITRILKKLEEKDVILKGNYNQNKYDRTNWYAFTDNAISILRNRGFHFANSSNGVNGIDEPIPDSNTDSNTYNKEEKEIAIALSKQNRDSTNLDNHNKAVLSNENSFNDNLHENRQKIYEDAANVAKSTIKQPRSKVEKLTAAEKYEIEFNKPLKDNEVKHNKYSGEVIAPNYENVLSFILEIGGTETLASNFFNQYEAAGWIAGKTKIKNWKAKAQAWKNQNDIWAAQEKRKAVLGTGIKRNPNTTDADAAYERNMKKEDLNLF